MPAAWIQSAAAGIKAIVLIAFLCVVMVMLLPLRFIR
jgi:hypothetical protein